MRTLPAAPDDATYWSNVHALPLPAWQPALEQICARHGLSAGSWQRFALGRNVVFGLGEVVVKLSPPFWAADIPREAAALDFVYGRLPVATPALLATGRQDDWGYLVQARLPGTLLHGLWLDLSASERAEVAYQHGALMAAIHALPIGEAPDTLRLDWPVVIGAQWQACIEGLQRSGVPEPLLRDAPAYLEAARSAVFAEHPAVLLHGDLNFLNLLVERGPDGWRITGLVDWSDVAIGPMGHELISPGVHMYRGDRATLHRWYAGYGLATERWSADLQREAMVRAILWYAEEFGAMLGRVPGATTCRSWAEVAECFWQLEGKQSVP
jgi:hygromycin-B 7''-O-kinase